jgi:hypothetical protein
MSTVRANLGDTLYTMQDEEQSNRRVCIEQYK